MRILLCAATPFEVAPVTSWLQQNYKPVEVAFTGVGLLATTFFLTKAVVYHPPDLIIQAGIAGSLDPSLPLGGVVMVGTETVGDLGVKEDGRFRSVFEMGLTESNGRPWTGGQLVNPLQDSAGHSLPVVNSVTVNQITTDAETIRYYQHTLGAQIESMEGAALHYVGLTEGISFLQIRSISNYAGVRDKGQWQIAAAVANLNNELIRILSKF
jgi:futalosine hydrolase